MATETAYMLAWYQHPNARVILSVNGTEGSPVSSGETRLFNPWKYARCKCASCLRGCPAGEQRHETQLCHGQDPGKSLQPEAKPTKTAATPHENVCFPPYPPLRSPLHHPPPSERFSTDRNYNAIRPSTKITSSMKITAGCRSRATVNKALTIFSPSPTYFEVREDAEMLKNVYPLSVATAFASMVLPVPEDGQSTSERRKIFGRSGGR